MVVSIARERLNLRPARESDRQQLANLMHFESRVHRHLDWRHPLDWICCRPYTVIEKKKRIIAALACPPDTPAVSWIRLFAVSLTITPSEAWESLWPVSQEYLSANVDTVAAIPFQNWFRYILEDHGFDKTSDVLMMMWHSNELPPQGENPESNIRLMNYDDLIDVQAIDQQAFKPIWHNSLDLLEIAFRQAAIAMVAENDNGLIGYQISTASSVGGHLARLAVRPTAQFCGVGYALVRDVLAQFRHRGVDIVTVNTQRDNQASLALYKKAGFAPTGESYPVYQIDLH
jgi:ribosomal protein S18 acetylase RimI-like enzyme